MAAAKKKPKAKAKTVKAKKPAPRKSAAPKKKAPARKPAAPKRKAAAPKKPVSPKAKPAARPAAKPKPKAPPPPARGPLPGEVKVGVVTHYYSHLSVAAVRLEVALAVGQTIRVLGHTSDFRQRVDSIQIEHEQVLEAIGGDEVGLRVAQHAREHDVVYRVPGQ
jgi:putative protease